MDSQSTDTKPDQVLLRRGTVWVGTVEGIAPEYAAMTLRVFGEEAGNTWLEQLRPICPFMSRNFVRPEWVGLLDFTTRFPNELERAMAGG